MIPHKLRLKNFIGIKSGIGLDDVTIDIDNYFTEDVQLVALVGPNGTGKSTILDNLHPYRLMPSRAGSYSPASFSFYDNIYGSEAIKELEWEHDGVLYKTSLLFKMTAKTKKAEAYLHRQVTKSDIIPEWEPMILPDGTASDGKAETYDRCVEYILGSPDMFFTSVFAAQNRRALSSYTNGEIKTLLSELLGIEHIRELSSRAAETAKLFRARLEAIREKIADAERLRNERGETQAALESAKAALSLLAQGRREARALVDKATKHYADVRANLGASTEIENRRTSLQTQYNNLQQRCSTLLRQLDSDIEQERRRASDVSRSATLELARLRKQSETISKQIKEFEVLLERKQEIDDARSQLVEREDQENESANRVTDTREAAQKVRDLQAERQNILTMMESHKREGKALMDTCEGLKARAGMIDSVPCQGTDLQPRCPLLSEANQAKQGISKAEADAAAKRDEYAALQAKGKVIDEQITAMGDTIKALRDAESSHQQIVADIRKLSEVAALTSALDRAEDNLASTRAQLDETAQAISSKETEIAEAERAVDERISELNKRRSEADQDAERERKAIQADLDALPPPADTSAIDKAKADLEKAETERDKIDLEHEQMTAQVATHKEKLNHIDASLNGLGAVTKLAEKLETEISHWTTLSKALGPDGIIALSIDDAGPTISALANDLLSSCYGPRFSIRIATQEQTAKGNAKESFDVIVFDAERDDEKSVRMMSGGERIWINECMTRAIALFQAQNSGKQYATLFADESDGALDPERKAMFLAMKRKVLELGRYQREYFISHTSELWDRADGVINTNELME